MRDTDDYLLQRKKEIVDKIEKVKGIKHSEEQMKILLHSGGKAVLACAGSGKTTVLTELLAVSILSGEINPNEILCTTYSKDGSKEIENRYIELTKSLGVESSISVKTLHASYFEVLRVFGILNSAKNGVCSNGKRRMLIIKACKLAGLDLTDEDTDVVNTLIGYQVNNLMSDEQLVSSPEFSLENVSIQDYSSIRQNYAKLKKEESLMDYDDMQLWMYALLKEGSAYRDNVINYCRSKWKYYLVDEFQDTSQIQFRILKCLVDNPDHLIVIGDDDQCIYKWRGADPNIILNIQAHYDVEQFLLPTNYRCSSNIVDFASRGVESLSKRANKKMRAFKDGGQVKFMDTADDNWYKTSKDCLEVVNDLKKSGVKNDEICIMVRNNVHAIIVANMLFKEGIWSNCADNMKISTYQIYKDYKDAIELMENTYNHVLVRRSIWKVVPYLGSNGASIISEFMNETGVDLERALYYILSRFTYSYVCDEDKKSVLNLKVPNKLLDRLEYRFRKVSSRAVEGLIELITMLSAKPKERVKWIIQKHSEAVSFIYMTEEKKRILKGISNYFNALIEEKSYEELKEFMRLTEQYENSDAFTMDSKINLTTMHSSKGLEWEHVIILGCDNISLPSFEYIKKYIEKGMQDYQLADYLDGERRLHYVAVTRAKTSLTILGSYHNMCMFTLECMGIIPKSNQNNELIIESARTGKIDERFVERLKEYYKVNKDLFINSGDLVDTEEEGDLP